MRPWSLQVLRYFMGALAKKISACVVLLLAVFFLKAQAISVSFNRIDQSMQSIDATTPEALAQQLTAPYHTDLEKVRSIFRWITENISYAVRPRVAVSRNALRYKPAPLDSLWAMKSVDEIVAYTVLQQRTAVCNGYARLFKTLCEYAGIRTELVTGYARDDWSHHTFRSNHTWNAVYVDRAWHLVDVTWASGYINFMDEFVKQYDDAFFFPDPAQFIYTHYPEDLKWSLLSNTPTLREFYQAPFRLTAFIKYGIGSYAPANGIVEAAVGDTLQFHLNLTGKTEFNMVPELNADSMQLGYDSSCVFIKPAITGSQVRYTYVVPSEGVQWLHLVFNDDVILRYRLNIRKPKS